MYQGKYIFLTAALMLVTACDNGPKQMQKFSQHFSKLSEERQNASRSETLIKTLHANDQFHISDITWCGGNKTLVSSGGIDTAILIWDTQKGKILRSLERASGSRAIACSKDGQYIASGSSAKDKKVAVRVWRIANSASLHDLEGPFPPIEGRNDSFAKYLAFNTDISRLYVHYVNRKRDNRLVVYEVPSWKIVNEISFSGRFAVKPTLSTNESLYAFGLNGRDIVIIDTQNGVEKIRFRTESLRPNVISFGRDDKSIYIGGERLYGTPHQGLPEQVIQEYSLINGELKKSIITGHIYGLSSMAFLKDSGLIITGSGDNTAEIRNSETGMLVSTLGDKTNEIESIGIRPDGKQFATAGRVINIWSLQ